LLATLWNPSSPLDIPSLSVGCFTIYGLTTTQKSNEGL
jgi:hypothetical protein